MHIRRANPHEDQELSHIAHLEALAADPIVGSYIDTSLTPPAPHVGSGRIRLIILGQDPTVKRPDSRQRIRTVLNLDRPGALRRYLEGICSGLGLELDRDVYATNFVNVFFTFPPASVTEVDLLGSAWKLVSAQLLDQLGQFPNVPILTLGQPMLERLVLPGISGAVREYWGYHSSWKSGATRPFQHLQPDENLLGRLIFPFPHQPSINKAFYFQTYERYVEYARQAAFEDRV